MTAEQPRSDPPPRRRTISVALSFQTAIVFDELDERDLIGALEVAVEALDWNASQISAEVVR